MFTVSFEPRLCQGKRPARRASVRTVREKWGTTYVALSEAMRNRQQRMKQRCCGEHHKARAKTDLISKIKPNTQSPVPTLVSVGSARTVALRKSLNLQLFR